MSNDVVFDMEDKSMVIAAAIHYTLKNFEDFKTEVNKVDDTENPTDEAWEYIRELLTEYASAVLESVASGAIKDFERFINKALHLDDEPSDDEIHDGDDLALKLTRAHNGASLF